MRALLSLNIILLLFLLVRNADLAVSSAIGRSFIRAVAYGLVAVLALIVTLITLFGL